MFYVGNQIISTLCAYSQLAAILTVNIILIFQFSAPLVGFTLSRNAEHAARINCAFPSRSNP